MNPSSFLQKFITFASIVDSKTKPFVSYPCTGTDANLNSEAEIQQDDQVKFFSFVLFTIIVDKLDSS
jgi:hypothetical protein